MNYNDSKDRISGYCPQCGSRLYYQMILKDSVGLGIGSLMLCSNTESQCNYKDLLSPDNINDADRHIIISRYFAQYDPFSCEINNWDYILHTILCFENINDFMYWLLLQIKIYGRLNDQTLNIGTCSPYPVLINSLINHFFQKYRNDFLNQLQRVYNTDTGDTEKLDLFFDKNERANIIRRSSKYFKDLIVRGNKGKEPGDQ